jgi:hypothetical protein
LEIYRHSASPTPIGLKANIALSLAFVALQQAASFPHDTLPR